MTHTANPVSLMSLRNDQFPVELAASINHMKQILENDKKIILLGDHPHQYFDKYAMAEYLTSMSISSLMNLLLKYDLNQESIHNLSKIIQWSKFSKITLRFHVEERYIFT
jgi:hypothetical protein